jgi:hypothetical protein
MRVVFRFENYRQICILVGGNPPSYIENEAFIDYMNVPDR